MVHNTSMLNLDQTVEKLLGSELGYLLLKTDGEDFYDILTKNTTYMDRQSMYGNDTHVTYHLFPLLYNKGGDIDLSRGITFARNAAVVNIFNRWTDAGFNRHHAKDPYNCKAFMKYLDENDFTSADYMLMLVQ